jgi:hypothetical protein
MFSILADLKLKHDFIRTKLQEALDELMQMQMLSPALAIQVLQQVNLLVIVA